MTMFRTLLEYFTQRSIDRQKPSPTWLRWIQRHDASLRGYETDARELDQMLQTSARARRQQLSSEVNSVPLVTPARREVRQPSHTKVFRRLGWLAATAAMLVGVTASVNHNTEQRTKSEQVRAVSIQIAAVPDEMLAMLTEAARTPREYSPLNRLSLPQVNVWKDLPRGAQGQLKQTMNTWGTQWTAIGERVYERFDFDMKTEIN
jgi:hypothetical protein